MDREKAIRLKHFELLQAANIRYDEGVIDIWDEKAGDNTNNIYILLARQNAQDKSNFCGGRWDGRIDIRIVNGQQDTLSKDVNDDVGEQVEAALQALSIGAEYGGWQFSDYILESVEYDAYDLSETKSILEKVLTYKLTAQKL